MTEAQNRTGLGLSEMKSAIVLCLRRGQSCGSTRSWYARTGAAIDRWAPTTSIRLSRCKPADLPVAAVDQVLKLRKYRASAVRFDHLVGAGDELWRQVEAKRLGGQLVTRSLRLRDRG